MDAVKLKVLIAEVSPVFSLGIESMLLRHEGVTTVSTASGMQEIIRKIRFEKIDLLVVDDANPDVTEDFPVRIRQLFPAIKLVVLTASDDSKSVRQLVGSGYHGILYKSDEAAAFSRLIDGLNRNERFLGPGIEMILKDQPGSGRGPLPSIRGKARLSRREFEVFSLLREGLNDKDIANKLSLSIQTVRQHHKSLKRKLAIAGILDALTN